MEGFYAGYFTAPGGMGFAMYVLRDGATVGCDAAGITFDGSYIVHDDGASTGIVAVSAPPGVTLVQGITAGPQGLKYEVPIRLPANFPTAPVHPARYAAGAGQRPARETAGLLMPEAAFWDFQAKDWLTLAVLAVTCWAVYYGPIKAVKIARDQREREARTSEQVLQVFATLMKTQKTAYRPRARFGAEPHSALFLRRAGGPQCLQEIHHSSQQTRRTRNGRQSRARVGQRLRRVVVRNGKITWVCS